MEKVGIEPRTLGYQARRFANCATNPVHPFYILAIAVVALVGFCSADVASSDPQVHGVLPISVPGPTPEATVGPHSFIYSVLMGLAGGTVALAFYYTLVISHEFLLDWYTRSQPTAMSHGVRSDKSDKVIMDI